MNDDFIRSLQKDWGDIADVTEKALRRVRRRRWMPHVIFGTELCSCATAMLAGVWFAWVAVHQVQHRLLYSLSAVVLLLSSPIMVIAVFRARRDAFIWMDETPEALLQIGVRRARSSLQVGRIARWHIVVIASFVAVLWAGQVGGLIDARDFLIFYTACCALVCIAAWSWMAWKENQLRSELAAYQHLLAALQDSKPSGV